MGVAFTGVSALFEAGWWRDFFISIGAGMLLLAFVLFHKEAILKVPERDA